MVKFIYFLLISGLASHAIAGDRVAQAVAQLQRQISLIESVQPFVERADLPRLFVLKSASRRVLESLQDEGRGPFHNETNREYQQLIVIYRYSKSFLDDISGRHTRGALGELSRITDLIAKTNGFDDSPYSLITMSTFNQLHKLVLQLLELDLEPALREELRGLQPALGKVMAVARLGDTFQTYREAIPVCAQVRRLYPRFNAIAASNAAFERTLEIQGLNEWYIDRSKLESELKNKPESR